jgi:hypothetical protein
MKQYIILKNNIEDLEAMVNEHIAKGYVAHGNLILSPQGTYVQAMTYTRTGELPTTTNKTKK